MGSSSDILPAIASSADVDVQQGETRQCEEDLDSKGCLFQCVPPFVTLSVAMGSILLSLYHRAWFLGTRDTCGA